MKNLNWKDFYGIMSRKIIVQKFGGTSVADTSKIKNVANTILREKNLGNDVVVVVSAMGHTTDHLVKMAKEISPNPKRLPAQNIELS